MATPPTSKNQLLPGIVRVLLLLATLYLFFFSIKLMGHSFKLFGKEFAERLVATTDNPFMGLAIGIFVTSLIQSSSTTTSIVVGLVAAGGLTLRNAIPIIMGANIGTTITNTIVSLAHLTRRNEFPRAFAGAIIHDVFNMLAVAILLPIEIRFRTIEGVASWLARQFTGVGGAKLFNPLNAIIKPTIALVDGVFEHLPHPQVWMLIIALVVLFFSLGGMVKMLRALMVGRMEVLLGGFLFRSDLGSMVVGVVLTASVQSSSITTSLVVPLVGAGLLTVRQIFPYVLGSNVGTTVTAILAALATQSPIAITAAFAHLMFNVFAIGILWWVKFIPIWLAENFARLAVRSKKHMAVCLVCYFMLYVLPLVLAMLWRGRVGGGEGI